MALLPGTRLGPYEILGPLGAGGMGEVYRARDPRIAREVAIKVLPPAVANDPSMHRRFEQEGRAAGALNHSNILAVYDAGTQEGVPYLVCELLEGETLRQKLAAGSLPARKAVEYGGQVARGLSAAHEKGIVHRDLKPENLFVTGEGQVKILDFGLAKVTPADKHDDRTGPITAVPAQTEPGAVLGTVGYMAPEQVRGQQADARSDIFALGAILHEMLTGHRAFAGDSAVEVLHAILKDDPSTAGQRADVPVALERVVLRCLEKEPAERFQSARDVGFALDALGESRIQGSAPRGRPRPSRRAMVLLALAVAALLAVGAGVLLDRLLAPAVPPSFQRLTYRRGMVRSARFAPDGQAVIYGAQWDADPIRVHTARPQTPESQPLPIPDADLLAVSASGELAIAMARPAVNSSAAIIPATLARVPLAGGVPRQLLELVTWADWTPDGASLAVAVRAPGRPERIELPIGQVRYEAPGRTIGGLRVSPRGDLVAFLDQVFDDPRGVVAVVDAKGRRTVVSPEWGQMQGLAWHGDEIWFSAAERADQALSLYATTLAGRLRLVARMPTSVVLHDVARDGRVLLATDVTRMGIVAQAPGEPGPRDLSWLDGSLLSDLSRDGRQILFTEFLAGGGGRQSVYLRGTDGSPAVRLGPGRARALSLDGRFALTVTESSAAYAEVVPTGAGTTRRLEGQGVRYWSGRFLPDGERIVLKGNEAGHGPRLWLQAVSGGPPQPLTPEGVGPWTVSLDGTEVAAGTRESGTVVYPTGGGPSRTVTALGPGETVFPGGFFDEHTVAFQKAWRVWRLDVATGAKQPWIDPRPSDQAGVWAYAWTSITPDGRAWASTYHRTLSDLYVVTGLH